MRGTSTLLIATVLAAGTTTPAAPQSQDPTLEAWQVPWEESRPRDPYVGPDGKVWFVGQRSHYTAYLDPATGEFKKFDLADGTGPHNLIVREDGMVFYAGNRATHIGKLDPATGEIEKYMMPDEAARDPHTLVWDHEGDIWFTVQGGNFVGHFDPEAGNTHLVKAPEVQGRRGGSSRPYGINVDSQNRPWIALFNTNMIATVDPAGMEMKTYELPEGARPRRLVIDSNDIIWYVDYRRGYLGRLDPGTGDVREWMNPGGAESQPYGMAIDSDDRIWFVETGSSPNYFVGFDPATEEFFSRSEVPTGGGAVRHMYYDPNTNAVWYGTDTNTIGRAKLPPLKRNVS